MKKIATPAKPAPAAPLTRPVLLDEETTSAILHLKPKTLEVWRWKTRRSGIQHGPPVTIIGRRPFYEEQALYRWIADQAEPEFSQASNL